jgi:carbon monoxide dehydrogenase subunit G
MGKIESKTGQLQYPDNKIYDFITDFNNFKQFIPEGQVKNWESSDDSCSFSLPSLGEASMSIIEKEPNKLVKVAGSGSNAIKFTIWIQLKMIADNDTRIKITLEPQMNKMMEMMAQKPLKKFIDMLVDRIEKMELKNS